eukprot:2300186-Prymnesium_polylepis.1
MATFPPKGMPLPRAWKLVWGTWAECGRREPSRGAAWGHRGGARLARPPPTAVRTTAHAVLKLALLKMIDARH